MRSTEMIGKVYGALRVVGVASSRPEGKAWPVIAECSVCGKEKAFTPSAIRRTPPYKSCGCVRKDNISAAHKKHGQACRSYRQGTTPEYRTWSHMKARCYDVKDSSYASYGGRGIQVCSQWLASFDVFLSDMGHRPGNGYSIERKQVDGNYTPENCCWIPMLEQAKNKRTNRLLTYKGTTNYLSAWANQYGIREAALRARLDQLGWSLENALMIPLINPVQSAKLRSRKRNGRYV